MTESPGDSPRVGDVLHARRPSSPVTGRGRLGALVRSYVVAAHDVGEDADERLRRTGAELRKESAAAVIEIARALGEAPSRDFPTRAALIHAAVALEHSDALP